MASNLSKITNLLPSGDNLALVNPDLFLENERLRSIAAGRTKWPWYPPEPTPSLTSTTQAFHRFKRLPPELRLLIWRLARLPRIIEVEKGKEGDFISWTLAPAMMHACHESRAVALEVYKELTGVDKYEQQISAWIDWKEDVVMFMTEADLKAFMKACVEVQDDSDEDRVDEGENGEDEDKAKVKDKSKARGEDRGNISLINHSTQNLAIPKSSFVQFQYRFHIFHHLYSLTQLILIQKISHSLNNDTGNLTLIDTFTDHRTQGQLLNFQAKNEGLMRAIVRDAERDNRRLLEGDEWGEEYKRREQKRKMNEDLLVAAKVQIEDLVHETKAENHSQ